jgi:ubiquinone/menaquinone biosynthesis C-methylase UbiE
MAKKKITPPTSWESSTRWYDKIVGTEGHYYHRQVILPKLLQMTGWKEQKTLTLLDIGCGQGILERMLPTTCSYTGVDISPSLVALAQKKALSANHRFLTGDVTKKLNLPLNNFTDAVFLLSLQNMDDPQKALSFAAHHLAPHGRLSLVLNHPCFRIPRQSSWEVDENKKLQYRRIDSYSSPLKVPIQMQPGREKSSPTTYSAHFSLAALSSWLQACNFTIVRMEEWHSDKESEGSKARMENRARKEFPLFLTLICEKKIN